MSFTPDGHYVSLKRGNTELQKTEINPGGPYINWSVPHIVHVQAVGDHHVVWIDGVKRIDYVDSNGVTNMGYVSLVRCYGWAKFDNFALIDGGTLDVQLFGSASAVKQAQDDAIVDLSGVVTAAFDGFFYVEDVNRASGIKVIGSQSVSVGDIVRVRGVKGTANGEQYISAWDVDKVGTGSISALGMNGRAFASSAGLSNIGLLIKTWGKVTLVDQASKCCVIKDGSNSNGIKVLIPDGVTVNQDSYIVCTGIACKDTSGVSLLHARTQSDIQASE